MNLKKKKSILVTFTKKVTSIFFLKHRAKRVQKIADLQIQELACSQTRSDKKRPESHNYKFLVYGYLLNIRSF